MGFNHTSQVPSRSRVILQYALSIFFSFLVSSICAIVGLSSTNLSGELFGRSFNQQPIAIFDLLDPSNTRNALVKFYKDMQEPGTSGIFHINSFGGV